MNTEGKRMYYRVLCYLPVDKRQKMKLCAHIAGKQMSSGQMLKSSVETTSNLCEQLHLCKTAG